MFKDIQINNGTEKLDLYHRALLITSNKKILKGHKHLNKICQIPRTGVVPREATKKQAILKYTVQLSLPHCDRNVH